MAGNPAVAAALRAASAFGHIETFAGVPTGEDWVAYRDVVRPERIGSLIERVAGRYGGCPTPAARTAVATLVAGEIASAFATPIAAALVVQRRALVLGPDLWIRLGPYSVDGVAAAAPTVRVLSTDPLAGRAGVTVADSPAALRGAAADWYAMALKPLVAAVDATTRRGRRALWADAADRLASAMFLAVGGAAGGSAGAGGVGAVDADAPAEIAGLFEVAPRALRHPIRWLDVPWGDGYLSWKRRTVCCLAYQTPALAGQLCDTCPLIPPEETVRRVGDRLRGTRAPS